MGTPIITPDIRKQLADAQAAAALSPPRIAPFTMQTNTLPALISPPLPTVTPGNVMASPNSGDSQVLRNQDRLTSLQSNPYGAATVHNPFLRGLATFGDAVGSFVGAVDPIAHQILAHTPGTTLNHNLQVREQEQRVAQDRAAAQASANLAQTQAGTRLTNDKANQAEAPASPDTEVLDTNQGKVLHVKGSTTATPLTGANGAALTDPVKPATNEFEAWRQQNPTAPVSDFMTLQSHPLSADEAASRNAIWDPYATKHGLPAGQFKAGMSAAQATGVESALNQVTGRQQGDTRIVIQQTGQQQRAAQLATRNGALDLSSPESQQAIQSLARGDIALNEVLPRGASFAQRASLVAAAKALNPDFNSGDHNIENNVRRYMTSGQGATTLNAGQTLTHHLGLYDQAVDAVHNGDIKLLNKVGNELGVQLGSDAQTNLNLIRQGVAMEAARFYTGGVPGEREIDQFNTSLSGDGSPAQMHGGANTVRGMAQGKMQALQAQSEAGSQGRPNFGGSGQGGKPDFVYVPGKGLVKQ